jgi:phage terminase large subunit GpA-like protein
MIQSQSIKSAVDLQQGLVELGAGAFYADAREPWLDRLLLLKKRSELTTLQFAKTRLIEGPTGQPEHLNLAKTPYIPFMLEVCDMEGVHIIGISACSRWGKTITGETKFLKHYAHGPSYNTLWYMQSEDDLKDYVDERVDWALRNHPMINEKINWQDPKNGRTRVQIGNSLALWRHASQKTLRGKAAPLIKVDEIDGMPRKIANAILTLVKNRQREFGSQRLAIFASHPDMAPMGGVWLIIADSQQHRWWWNCLACGQASSPCQDATMRMRWNVKKFLKLKDEMTREKLLDMVEQDTRLVCPHPECKAEFTNEDRLKMNATGAWLQNHQELGPKGEVIGEYIIRDQMGFVGHAFMSPWVNINKLARDWVAAKLTFDDTGDDTTLREENVKTLGERHEDPDGAGHVDDWKSVKARLRRNYLLKTVPPGVLFLTQFIDIQGGRFEVRVIGWDLAKRSWLIDAYAIKQWPVDVLGPNPMGAFQDIDPANRLSDWDIIEKAVLFQHYPMQQNMQMCMPIAKTIIDAVGEPGVTANARTWLANIMAREYTGEGQIIPPHLIQLIQNSNKKDGPELYGRPLVRQYADDAGMKKLAVDIRERMPLSHKIKFLIAKRMQIHDGAPGQMAIPANCPDRYVRELVSETLINDEWTPRGRNETWDGWVNCETARYCVMPDRPGLWVETPDWAKPVERSKIRAHTIEEGVEILTGDNSDQAGVSVWDRYRELNDKL